MNKVARYSVQVLLYVAFGAAIGYFSSRPAFEVMPRDQALVRLSFSHGAKPVTPCRERSEEELAKLPPNMRVKLDCPRERAPVKVEIEMDGQPLYAIVAPPAGIKRDGASTVYRRGREARVQGAPVRLARREVRLRGGGGGRARTRPGAADRLQRRPGRVRLPALTGLDFLPGLAITKVRGAMHYRPAPRIPQSLTDDKEGSWRTT
jgi:hypothetical protein